MMKARPIAGALITLVVATSAFLAPQPAHAQLVVHDPLNWIQNTITATFSGKSLLKPIFYRMAQAAIHSLTQSTVRWINSGFQGSPAYVTDLTATLQDAADQEANRFLGELQRNLQINSPFRDNVAVQVLQNYYLSSSRDGFYLRNPYTLNQVSPNPQAFQQGDFLQGGFRAWIVQSLAPQNTALGVQDLIQGELDRRLSGRRDLVTGEVDRGNGFFSWRRCDLEVSQGGQQSAPGITVTGENDNTNLNGVSLTQNQTCFQSHIETPGSVIAASINHTLGLGADSLVQADDFDEIVNALMVQLLNNVLGPQGLGGLTRGSGSSGGRDYFNQDVAGPGNSASNGGVSVMSSFLQIIDGQTTQLQGYLSNWQAVSASANAAQQAVQQSTCLSDAAKSSLTAEAQAVITEAAGAIGTVPSALSSLDSIRNRALNAAALDAAQQTTVVQQISAEYQNLLASNALPDAGDITHANDVARDSGTAIPPSLFTRMNQITAQAQCQ